MIRKILNPSLPGLNAAIVLASIIEFKHDLKESQFKSLYLQVPGQAFRVISVIQVLIMFALDPESRARMSFD